MNKDLIKIKNKLISTQKQFIKADESQRELYDLIREYLDGRDLSNIYSYAENADDLEDAIGCFCTYGEYNVAGILQEIEDAKR